MNPYQEMVITRIVEQIKSRHGGDPTSALAYSFGLMFSYIQSAALDGESSEITLSMVSSILEATREALQQEGTNLVLSSGPVH